MKAERGKERESRTGSGKREQIRQERESRTVSREIDRQRAEQRAVRESRAVSARLKREGSEGDISSEHQRAGDSCAVGLHSVWKSVNRLLCGGDDGELRLMKVKERSEG